MKVNLTLRKDRVRTTVIPLALLGILESKGRKPGFRCLGTVANTPSSWSYPRTQRFPITGNRIWQAPKYIYRIMFDPQLSSVYVSRHSGYPLAFSTCPSIGSAAIVKYPVPGKRRNVTVATNVAQVVILRTSTTVGLPKFES
jgi:hypothetical protein